MKQVEKSFSLLYTYTLLYIRFSNILVKQILNYLNNFMIKKKKKTTFRLQTDDLN